MAIGNQCNIKSCTPGVGNLFMGNYDAKGLAGCLMQFGTMDAVDHWI